MIFLANADNISPDFERYIPSLWSAVLWFTTCVCLFRLLAEANNNRSIEKSIFSRVWFVLWSIPSKINYCNPYKQMERTTKHKRKTEQQRQKKKWKTGKQSTQKITATTKSMQLRVKLFPACAVFPVMQMIPVIEILSNVNKCFVFRWFHGIVFLYCLVSLVIERLSYFTGLVTKINKSDWFIVVLMFPNHQTGHSPE